MKEKIKEILEQFAKEETGNRLSQFAMIALTDIIINVMKIEEDKKEVKEDVKGNKKKE